MSAFYHGPADLLWRDHPSWQGPRSLTKAEADAERAGKARPKALMHVCAFSIFAEGPTPSNQDPIDPRSRPARDDYYGELHAAGAVRLMGVAECRFCEETFGTWLANHYPEPRKGPRYQAIVAPAVFH